MVESPNGSRWQVMYLILRDRTEAWWLNEPFTVRHLYTPGANEETF